jgi:hypothetical protein
MNEINPLLMVEKGERGKLYRWNGTGFEELRFDEAAGQKLPVTDEAVEAVKAVRKAVQASLGMRPELSIVASAMLIKAGEAPEVVEAVKRYGLRLYSKNV